ncbi:MAG: hypothetical protein BACD_03139 [Bacteroides rodentium]
MRFFVFCFNILVNPASACSLHFYCKRYAVALQSCCSSTAKQLQSHCITVCSGNLLIIGLVATSMPVLLGWLFLLSPICFPRLW